SPNNACWIAYARAANQIYLFNDNAMGVVGPLTPGVAGSLRNSQCKIDGGSSSVTSAGSKLILNLGVSSKSGTPWNAYMLAIDNSGAYSGWQKRATLTVPAGF